MHKLNRIGKQTERREGGGQAAKSPNVKTDWKHNLNINLKENFFLVFFLCVFLRKSGGGSRKETSERKEPHEKKKKKKKIIIFIYFLFSDVDERGQSFPLVSSRDLDSLTSVWSSSDLLSTVFLFVLLLLLLLFREGPFFTLRVACNMEQKQRNTWNITHWRLSWPKKPKQQPWS